MTVACLVSFYTWNLYLLKDMPFGMRSNYAHCFLHVVRCKNVLVDRRVIMLACFPLAHLHVLRVDDMIRRGM
jgi:hypothetical protein